MTKLLPLPAVRDEDGYFIHPVLLDFWVNEMGEAEHCTKEQFAAWEERNGIETNVDRLEFYPLDHPAYVDYFDNGGNASLWKPESPGPDWFLIEVAGSEDGPFAVFARHKDSS